MTHFTPSHLRFAAMLASLGLCLSLSAHAQPMPGMGMPADGMMGHAHMTEGHPAHTQMAQRWQARQQELKSKLKLSANQEPAWNSFVEAMKPPATAPVAALDRDALAKLTTPERVDTMAQFHAARQSEMHNHVKQRGEAAKQFYGQLTAEQQKVFDAETLPREPQHRGRMGQGPTHKAN